MRLGQSKSEVSDKAIPSRRSGTVMSPRAAVRQILERPGEVLDADAGTDKLVVIRTTKYRRLLGQGHAGAAASITGLLQKVTQASCPYQWAEFDFGL